MAEGQKTFDYNEYAARLVAGPKKETDASDTELSPDQLTPARKFLDELKSFGVTPTPEAEAKALAILASPAIVDTDPKQLIEMLSIDETDKELDAKISASDLRQQYHALIERQFHTQEYRDLILAADLGYLPNQEIRVDGRPEQLDRLTDPEMKAAGIDELKDHITRLLHGRSGFAQGMFWNVTYADNVPYVLKTARKKQDLRDAQYNLRALARYPFVRDHVGSEFFPKQAVLLSQEKNELMILQEKVDAKGSVLIDSRTIGAVVSDPKYQDLRDVARRPENQAKIQRFLDGLQSLRASGLILDFEGQNLFMRVENDELKIIVVDYGTSDAEYSQKLVEADKTITNNLQSLIG